MSVTAHVAVARLNEAGLRIEEVRLPDPGPDQVIVKEFFSGICHSQLHEIHGTTLVELSPASRFRLDHARPDGDGTRGGRFKLQSVASMTAVD